MPASLHMISEKPLKILHVGLGRWGRIILRNLAAMPEQFRLVGVVSRSNSLPNDIAIDPVPCFPDIHAALRELQPDAVSIACEPDRQAAIALTGLRNGLAVFCEKPCATSPREMQALAEAASACNSLLFVDYIHVHSRGFQTLLAGLPADGPFHIRAFAGGPGPDRDFLSPFWDWGVHDVAMLAACGLTAPCKVQIQEMIATHQPARRLYLAELAYSDGSMAELVFGNGLLRKSRSFSVSSKQQVWHLSEEAGAVALSCDGKPVTFPNIQPLEAALLAFHRAASLGGRSDEQLDLSRVVTDTMLTLRHHIQGAGA